MLAHPVLPQIGEDTKSTIFMVVIGVVIVGLAILAQLAKKRRREALHAFAQALRCSFDPDEDGDFPDARPHSWFKQGHSRYAYNRIEGRRTIASTEFRLLMGDFHWVTGSGKNRATHEQSYMLLVPEWRNIPNLQIRTENIFDKIGDALGFDDIDFESEEFSRKFMVKSTDKRFAYAVVTPAMMEQLLRDASHDIDLTGGEFRIGGIQGKASPGGFGEALEWAERFIALWPEHLVREMRQGGFARTEPA